MRRITLIAAAVALTAACTAAGAQSGNERRPLNGQHPQLPRWAGPTGLADKISRCGS